MDNFTTQNTREHIAHLLNEAGKAVLSTTEPLASVEKSISAANALLRDLSDETPKHGDYELAKAKRRLEALLREEGHTKSEAMEIVYHHFKG